MQNYRPFSGITPAVKVLIIVNVAMYLLSLFVERSTGVDTARIMGLYQPPSYLWRPWQYVTHMFMHGSISHLFFNMFALFMFGRILESVWGSKRFLTFYFVCGIGAGLLNSLAGWYESHSLLEQYAAFQANPTPDLLTDLVKRQLGHPTDQVWQLIDGWINNPDYPGYAESGKQLFLQIINRQINIPMIGASGAVFGILLAFGMLFPNTELYLIFFPIPIKAKYFVIGYGLLEIYLGILNNAADNIAHFAHIGGMLFGFLLVKHWNRNRKKFF